MWLGWSIFSTGENVFVRCWYSGCSFIDRIRSHKQSRHYMCIRHEINNIVFECQGNYLGNHGVLETY